ncbi:trehalase isoform X1 [Bemisia tabaci]|uniref:trehalase isoform X1 n=1 Tax=Bemisia tabaci TaxID=7038 RepID=UPI0008F9CFCB|nr:PREDICTED: trehalase-like isoform X2 [Bemisia tabaci]
MNGKMNCFKLLCLLTFFGIVVTADEEEERLPANCPSEVYCHGTLLHTVQMAGLYHDSKTFVDMKMKFSPNETVGMFAELMKRTESRPSRLQLELFVNETFEPPGSEFEAWDPSDWVQTPGFLGRVKDKELSEWAAQLNDLWKFLGRKMRDDIKHHPDLYSIIYVPNPVIVPGGRFREFYYWDSYWIIRGLLLSEMYHTVRGMLENFLTIVEEYGLIPNGGRVYYAKRSHPPLLIPMVKSYLDTTKNITFLRANIDTMEKEFLFWMTNHTVKVEKNGKFYTLARYKDSSSGPRPESYREDYMSAQIFRSDKEKESYYSELKSAAESGWDFSSRWFVLNGTNKGNLTNAKTTYLLPVELNAILYWNAVLLSEFFRTLGQAEKAIKYEELSKDWMEAVTEVLWHDEVGAWLDYDIVNEVKRDYFYPTNISPLWTGCFEKNKTEYFTAKVMKYLEKTQIMVNLGGIPTTLEHSGEQWDYPNAWPPLQYIMIMSLDATGDSWAQDLAYEMSERWVRSNFKAYNETGIMYEKYDATVPGGHGGGGEYEVQMGFGWTNGIIMELLDKYGERMTAEDRFIEPPQQEHSIRSSALSLQSSLSAETQVLTVILALIATLAAGFIGHSKSRKFFASLIIQAVLFDID